MPFGPPSWVPKLPEIPDVPLCEFMTNERHGRASFDTSLPAYVCGVTGREVTIAQLKDNIESIARGLAAELDWQPNEGDELSKAIAIFALNTACLSSILSKMWADDDEQVDVPALTWAIHRIGNSSQNLQVRNSR